jgi:protein-tyrosine phosphatase
MSMIRILFVCMGNICRSPAGAAILRHLVDNSHQVDKVKVDSCGLADWNRGDPPDERMVDALRIRGIELQGRAKSFTTQFLDEFTHILAVDREVLTKLHLYAKTPEQRSKIVLLTAFSARYPEQDVPDPYGGGQRAFELVLDMLEDACEGFLKTL